MGAQQQLAPFALEAAFVEATEASARERRDGEPPDAAYARTCLDALRQAARGSPNEPLLLRLHAAFGELIFSDEPYVCAPQELRVPWFDVARRVHAEKRD